MIFMWKTKKPTTADNTEFVASVLTHFRSNAFCALHKPWEC